MNKVILEFNEEQQGFHINNGMNKENTFGWGTIAYCTSDEQANSIADFLEKQNKNKKITLKTAKETANNLLTFLLSNKVRVLTKEEVEANRSSAYNYAM